MEWLKSLSVLLTSWNGIPYLDAMNCVINLAPAIIICILCISNFIAYVVISRKWAHCEQKYGEEGESGFKKLRWIFNYCAVSGYLWVVLHFFWPAYNLYIIALFILNIWSWSFAITANKDLEKDYEVLVERNKLREEVKKLRQRLQNDG